jgi:acyl-CoA synthetase (AMP-forming)/AMP-acid ligase II
MALTTDSGLPIHPMQRSTGRRAAMIFRSPYPDVTIPDLPLTPFVLRHAGRLANKPALIDGATGRTLTYGQLADGVRRTATGLAARGFRQGDVFATVCPNLPEFALAFYGAAACGGATTTLSPLLTVEEQVAQLRDAAARFVLTAPERLDVVREAANRAGVEEVFVSGEAEGATPFASLLDSNRRGSPVAINPAEDVVALPYSSGTTGRAKGVMLTHRNQIAHVLVWRAIDQIAEDETAIIIFPLAHIAGILNLNRYLHAGASVVLMPRYDFQSLLRLLQEYRVARFVLAPPVALELSRHPSVATYDLSQLAVIHWGAAPLSEAVVRACRERLGCRVKQVYGLTETNGVTHVVPTAGEDRPESAGPPLPNTECKIVDIATGVTLGPGQSGEVCVRGPQVMKGYLNRPEATAQAIDAEGWLHTGDLGVVDADGWLTVVDRLKELIKYKGYQVAPAELEAVLLDHPCVADAAVIPSPDEEAGEAPKAFVVLKGEASAEELMSFVAARVVPYKKVRRLEFTDQIPKSPSGKILRRLLVERERATMPSLA